MPSFRGSPRPRDWTQVDLHCRRIFTVWTTREAQQMLLHWPQKAHGPPTADAASQWELRSGGPELWASEVCLLSTLPVPFSVSLPSTRAEGFYFFACPPISACPGPLMGVLPCLWSIRSQSSPCTRSWWRALTLLLMAEPPRCPWGVWVPVLSWSRASWWMGSRGREESGDAWADGLLVEGLKPFNPPPSQTLANLKMSLYFT